ncbi:MAG: hypothetical protein B6I17_02005 [Tenericutes bacterium 4572_104]|nr:MAG: hypothetical protein B6I17_02005 [Tenericutes bacterium 4572_104]
MASKRVLYRDVDNGKISGVCAGLSDYLDIDVTLIRVIWLILVLCVGTGLLAYIIMALVVEPKQVVMAKINKKRAEESDDPFAKYD